jgi:4-hydroxy-4-methyl-2-oxoglutarate aldolase
MIAQTCSNSTPQANLYSAAISDALDSLGWRRQWMRHSIQPLSPEYAICGPAATMHIAEVEEEDTEAPYEMLIQSLDSLQPGEVVVIDCDGSENIAVWGELLSTAARARGAVGVVMDGLCRDVARVLRMRFPAFGRGTLCTDIRGRGRVVSFRKPVCCGGVRVNPGDMIFGDIDGVLAVPADLWSEVFERASQKARTEDTVRDEIRKGAFLRDVWAKHKVL